MSLYALCQLARYPLPAVVTSSTGLITDVIPHRLLWPFPQGPAIAVAEVARLNGETSLKGVLWRASISVYFILIRHPYTRHLIRVLFLILSRLLHPSSALIPNRLHSHHLVYSHPLLQLSGSNISVPCLNTAVWCPTGIYPPAVVFRNILTIPHTSLLSVRNHVLHAVSFQLVAHFP